MRISATGVSRVLLCSIFAVHGLASAQSLSGRDARIGVSAGYGQSDNLGREVVEGDRSAFHWLGIIADIGTERRRFTGKLSGDIQLREYAEGDLFTFIDQDEVLGSLDGSAAVVVVPDVFTWNFTANTGQLRTSPLDAPSPWNREQVNVWSTGPTLRLPISDRAFVRLGAQKRERNFEESDRLASTTNSLDLSLTRALSPVSRGSVGYARNEVSYDESMDYVLESAYLSYERPFANGGVELQIGASDVSGPQTNIGSTPFIRLRWNRGLGTRSNVSVWASRELTDPGELFRTGGVPGLGTDDSVGAVDSIDLGDARVDGVVLSEDPMKRSAIGLAFSVERDLLSFFFFVNVSEERFQVEHAIDAHALNNESLLAQFSVNRELSRRWRGGFSIHSVERRFESGLSNNDLSGQLSLRRAVARRGSIELLFQRNARSGDIDPSDENLYALSMSYRLID